MNGPFGGEGAGIEFEIFYFKGFLAEEPVAGQEVGNLVDRAVLQAGGQRARPLDFLQGPLGRRFTVGLEEPIAVEHFGGLLRR